MPRPGHPSRRPRFPPRQWEAAMLPVRSAKLTAPSRGVIEAPGLRPFVVIGDDEASQAWLRRRGRVAQRARSAWWSTSRPRRAWRGCAPWCRAYRSRRGRRRPGRSPGPATLPGADHGHRHRAMTPCQANSRSRFCYAQRWSYTPSRRVQAPRFCAWWPHGRSR